MPWTVPTCRSSFCTAPVSARMLRTSYGTSTGLPPPKAESSPPTSPVDKPVPLSLDVIIGCHAAHSPNGDHPRAIGRPVDPRRPTDLRGCRSRDPGVLVRSEHVHPPAEHVG